MLYRIYRSTTSLKHPSSAMNSLSSHDRQINEAAKEPSVARHILLHLQPECHLLHVASKSADISEPFRTSKVSKPDDFPNWGDAWTHQIVGGQGQGFSGWILPTSQGSLVEVPKPTNTRTRTNIIKQSQTNKQTNKQATKQAIEQAN